MLLRYDPFRQLDQAMDELRSAAARAPGIPMDAIRRGDQVVIMFDLPGIDDDSLDLTVERDVLTIKAERTARRQDGEQMLADERPKGSSIRRVLLGETLDTSRLEASYEAGVLTVTIPMAEAAQPRRIEVGGSGGRRAIDTEARNGSDGASDSAPTS